MHTLESERKSQILADMTCLTVKPMSIESLIRIWQKSKIHSERFVTKQRLNANMMEHTMRNMFRQTKNLMTVRLIH